METPWHIKICDCRKIMLGKRLDVIIFGATGCAGRFTIFEATRVLKYYRWGVAGRNKKKLQAVLQEVGIETRKNLTKIPIISANIKNQASLYAMAKRCRVIVNCCGPYEYLGENVIKACISARTHYVDLCTESHFMDYILYKYDEYARKKNVNIVMGCGLQSIPIDIGINYMKEHFHGTINNIDAYSEFWSRDPYIVGSVGNNNLWTSLILGNSNIKKFRRKLFPRIEPRAYRRPLLYESEITHGFCVPSPTVDEDVVDRSQYYFYDEKNKRPIQFYHYFSFPNPFVALAFLIWYFIIMLLSQITWGRGLLLNWPRIFSLGIFSSIGPREESTDDTFFSVTFIAEGWGKYRDSDKHFREAIQEKPNKLLLGKVSGTCPIYGVACVCLLVSALTILTENRKRRQGGILTPGAAFANTKIINTLGKHKHGLTFELIY